MSWLRRWLSEMPRVGCPALHSEQGSKVSKSLSPVEGGRGLRHQANGSSACSMLNPGICTPMLACWKPRPAVVTQECWPSNKFQRNCGRGLVLAWTLPTNSWYCRPRQIVVSRPTAGNMSGTCCGYLPWELTRKGLALTSAFLETSWSAWPKC